MTGMRAERMALAVWTVVSVGVVLRIRQFVAGRSFWLDEALVVADLHSQTLFESLTEPSPNGQLAPPGFWVALNAAARLSTGEAAMRAFPLVVGIGLVVVAAVYARRNLQHWWAQLGFVSLLSLSPSLIYYSSEVKQYGVEAGGSMLALVAVAERERLGRGWLTLFGVVWIVFSLPALVLVPVLGVLWFAEEWVRRGEPRAAARWLLGPGLVLGATVAASYLNARRLKPPAMDAFWSDAMGPLPIDVDGLTWWLRAWADLVHTLTLNRGIVAHAIPPGAEDALASFVGMVAAALATFGAFAAWRSRRTAPSHDDRPIPAAVVGWSQTAVVGGAAIAVMAGLSVVDQYPFRGRLLLHLVPFVVALIAHGADAIGTSVDRTQSDSSAWRALQTRAGVAACALLALAAVSVPGSLRLLYDPVLRFPAEEGLAWIDDQDPDPGDIIVLHGQSWHQFQRYGGDYDFSELRIVRYDEHDLSVEALAAYGEGGQVWYFNTFVPVSQERLHDDLASDPAVIDSLRDDGLIVLRLDPTLLAED